MPTNFGNDFPICPLHDAPCHNAFVDVVPIGLYRNDRRGHCTYVNNKACDILDMTFQEALGWGWSDRLHPEDKECVIARWQQALSAQEPWQAEYRFIRRDGSVVWVLTQCVFTFDECGNNTGSIGSLTDITAQKDLEATLEQVNQHLHSLVHLDGLTEVPNRRHFDEYLAQAWLRLERQRQPLSLMMIDIDYFKPYNDTYGHIFGDKILKVVAQTADRVVRQYENAMLARYGGEEFAAILPDSSPTAAAEIADAIVKAVRDLQIHHQGSQIGDYLTLSIGLTTLIPTPEQNPERALHEADIALYLAKASGRDRVIVYSDAIATDNVL